jgi:hypothetical protein
VEEPAVMLGVGRGLTVVEILLEVSLQPNELVAITDQLAVVETVRTESVAPEINESFLSHWKVDPPAADSTTESPKQKVVEELAVILGVGSGLTVVEMLLEVSLQPKELVAMTDQVAAVETVKIESVAPFIKVSFRNHWKVVPPDAVSATESPEQKVVEEPTVMPGVGRGLTVVEMLLEVSQHPKLLVAITDQLAVDETVNTESVAPVITLSFRNH